MSSELILRLEAYPKMRDELDRLPPKMLSLSSERKVMPVELDSKLDSRISEVVESIQRAKFTGTGDDKKVPAMYKDYVDKIASMLTKSLSLLPASFLGVAQVSLPKMPRNASAEGVRKWHLDLLKEQHGKIADALSGTRLDVLEECVQIAITGIDSSGKPLTSVKDAAGLSAWLGGAAIPGTRALLVAARRGQTWLMS